MGYLLMSAVYIGTIVFFKASVLTSILLGVIFLLLAMLLEVMNGISQVFSR